jgi:phospholipid transport system substrate-binding protein
MGICLTERHKNHRDVGMRNHWSVPCYILAGVLLGSLMGVQVVAESESPMQLVQRLVKAIVRMKPSQNGTLSAAEQAANAAAAKEANAILDIPAVAQRTLGKHWQARTPAERQEFITLLEQLFTKVAYPKSAEFFHGLEVNFAKETINGQRATVKTTVRHPKEGLVSVDYRLVQEGGTWRVQDILLDDVSLAANLQSQFNKIITENSYAELLRRMRDKLNE